MTDIAAILLALTIALPTAAPAQDPTFWGEIRPIFQKHCTICHSTKNIGKKEIGGGLALTTFDATVKDPKEPVVVPGKSGESKLFQLLITADEETRMPKDSDALPASDIELIRNWIDRGAKEGARPDQTPTEPVESVAVKRPTSLVRSIDVVINTSATLTPEAAKKLNLAIEKPAKLDLAIKVGPLPPVTALAFSPDGRILAAGSYGSVVLWDQKSAEPLQTIDMPSAVHSIVFNASGTRMAAAGGLPARSGLVTLFDTANWQVVTTFGEHGDAVYDAAFSPDSQWLATASLDKTVRIWDLKSESAEPKSHRTLKGHSDFVYSVAFTSDGKWLLSSSKDRSIKVFRTENWESERTLSGHNEEVLALATSADSVHAVSAGKEPQLKWWVIESGQNNRTIPGHSGTVNELMFSRDGQRIASVGQDKQVRIWDAAEGKLLRSISGSSEWLYSVALSPDAKTVAAGSWDGVVRVWETESGRHLVSLISVLSPDPAKPQWIVLAPEGYYHASDELAAILQWRAGDQSIAGEMLTTTLRQAEPLRKALRGEPVEAVQFPATN